MSGGASVSKMALKPMANFLDRRRDKLGNNRRSFRATPASRSFYAEPLIRYLCNSVGPTEARGFPISRGNLPVALISCMTNPEHETHVVCRRCAYE
jgi:hypothetical protein